MKKIPETKFFVSELGKNLIECRKKAKLTRDEVVSLSNTGFARSSLQAWEAGEREPKLEHLCELATIYNVSLQSLITGIDTIINTQDDDKDKSDEYAYIPYYSDVVASAGHGTFSDGVVSTDESLAFRRDWIENKGLYADNLVALKTFGDSMAPTIPDSATILVDKSRNQAKDGNIYVIRIDDELYVKRLQKTPNGLLLISDNNIYRPLEINLKNPSNDIQIYGQVIHLSYDLPH